MPDDYAYQERAAIMEFDAGLSRLDAEAAARCCCSRKSHLAAPLPPDSAGSAGSAAAPAPQPPSDPAADRRAPPDTAGRGDPGAGYSRRPETREPVGTPYAQAAARASPVYLESCRQLAEILKTKQLKGAIA